LSYIYETLQKRSQPIPKTGHVTKIDAEANSRWRRPPSLIRFIAHNSVGIAHICTKFGMQSKLDVPHAVVPLRLTETKSKMAAAAILNFYTKRYNSADD